MLNCDSLFLLHVSQTNTEEIRSIFEVNVRAIWMNFHVTLENVCGMCYNNKTVATVSKQSNSESLYFSTKQFNNLIFL